MSTDMGRLSEDPNDKTKQFIVVGATYQLNGPLPKDETQEHGHFLPHTITLYPKLSYQLRFCGLPIFLFLTVLVANLVGFLQTTQILTITPHSLSA
jgi:hypothetical protein